MFHFAVFYETSLETPWRDKLEVTQFTTAINKVRQIAEPFAESRIHCYFAHWFTQISNEVFKLCNL